MSSTDYLFVYGTLRKEAKDSPLAERLSREAEHVGVGAFRGRLYLLDWYPGVVDSESDEDQVVGDVFRIGRNENLLRALDAYEECSPEYPEPREYKRAVRDVRVGGELLRAWVYLYNWPLDHARLIPGGDFLKAV